MIDEASRVDISFNAVGIPNAEILGGPLIELDVERFPQPVAEAYTRSYFLTARLATRRMLPSGSGVVMTVIGTPLAGRASRWWVATARRRPRRRRSLGTSPSSSHLTASVSSACDHRRCRRPALRDAYEPRAEASGMTWEQWQEMLASRTHRRRLMTLEERANVAAFMASDQASGMTGTTVNLTMGQPRRLSR